MKYSVYVIFFISLLSVSAAFTPVRSQQTTEYRAALSQLPFFCTGSVCRTREMHSEFPFDSFFIEWPSNVPTRVRFFERGKWIEWSRVDGENDTPDSEDIDLPYDAFFFSDATGYQIETTQEGMQKGVITYFSLLPYQRTRNDQVHMAVNEAPADLTVISRSDWLDSSLELSVVNREKLWPAEYDGVKKIVIHHTASTLRDMNNDGLIDSNDYRSAVRAIYNYHAKSRKWGDVGYHFIIDPDGTIWEGRFGGDGVVGGHAHRERACKKFGQSGTGFNKGSIGISLLGTYEDGDITPQAKEALTSLIARKAWEFDFEPVGRSFFVDQEYSNVVAHRDIDCTTCPGQKLYAYLPSIVAQAQEKYASYSLSHLRRVQGEIVDVSSKTVELKEGEERTVTVRFRNTGTVAWRNYGDTALYMADAQIKNHLASLDTLKLAATDESERDEGVRATPPITDFTRAHLVTPNVYPGEIGTFLLSIKDPPKDFIEERHYVFALGTRGWVPAQEVVLEVINTGLPLSTMIVKENAWQKVFDEETQMLVLQFKNYGTQNWKKGDVTLSLMATDDASMNLRNEFWKHKRGRVSFLEDEVTPQGIATFHIPITPRRIGDIVNTVFLEKAKEKIVGSDREALHLSVTPAYVAELVSSHIPSAVLSGWRSRADVMVKNVGAKTWDAATLQSIGKNLLKQSVFQDSSWKGVTEIDHAKGVEPGSVVSFLFKLMAPKKEGLYTERLALTNKERTIYFLTDKGFEKDSQYAVRVDGVKKKGKK
ncbi:N-acetylmuramoyl-L-alanine amidase [Candidatus Uhrbacteria bacterium]|nr:N-acetylmuramoyl-L-alanine amidase [Candidatus Uhrbacteria bacterium]